jgi:hypothetical protein
MEAATAAGPEMLTRDGAVPAAPPLPPEAAIGHRQPIDGVARCSCCDRFPLVGEQVVRHSGRKRSGWVCERCEAAGRGEAIGAAGERVRIRWIGGARNVRRSG